MALLTARQSAKQPPAGGARSLTRTKPPVRMKVIRARPHSRSVVVKAAEAAFFVGKSMAARRVTHKDVAFWYGDIVYLRVRQDRKPGLVTCVSLHPTGVMYSVAFEDGDSDHHEFELSAEYLPDYGTED